MKKQARKPNGRFAALQFTCTTTTGYLRIFIDGLLHICIDNTVPILVHSYKQRKDWYCIELQSGEHTVITEYDSKEKWTAILRLLDENI